MNSVDRRLLRNFQMVTEQVKDWRYKTIRQIYVNVIDVYKKANDTMEKKLKKNSNRNDHSLSHQVYVNIDYTTQTFIEHDITERTFVNY